MRRRGRATAVAVVFAVVAAVPVTFFVRTRSASADGVYPDGAATALLRTSDLGPGWTSGGLRFDIDAPFVRPCGREPAAGSNAVQRSAEFHKDVRSLSHRIAVYRSLERAAAAVDDVRDALGGCRRWTERPRDGRHVSLVVTPRDAPELGDEAVAYGIVATVEPVGETMPVAVTAGAEIVVVRRLNVVSVVASMAVGDAETGGSLRPAHARAAAAAADARLSRVPTVSRRAAPRRAGGDTVPAPAATSVHVGVGETVALDSLAEDVRVGATLLEVVDPATGEDGHRPKAGYRFVAVRLRLGNLGPRTYVDAPANGAILVDADHQQYSPGTATITAGPGLDGHVRIAGDGVRVGFLVFEVPQRAGLATLQLALDAGFGPRMAEWELGDVRPR